MAERETQIIYCGKYAYQLKDPTKLKEMLGFWQKATGNEWISEFLDGRGVVIRPKPRLEGETPKSRGE